MTNNEKEYVEAGLMTNMRATVSNVGGAGNRGPREALGQILETVGWNGIPADHVKISGDDPMLPSDFRIGAAGASTIGAAWLAAAALWESRTGQPLAM